MGTSKIKFVAHAVRWFDKANGNTYHSVRVTKTSTGKTIYCGWTFGYDDSYKQTALQAMLDAGWIPKRYKDKLYLYERENNYPISWHCVDGRKQDMVANGMKPGS